MEEFEKKINLRYGNTPLPKNIIDQYIVLAKENDLILDEEMDQLPSRMTLSDLKMKLTEFRRSLFLTSFDSFGHNIVYDNKENINNSSNKIDSSHFINKNNKTNNKIGITMYHSLDDQDNFDKKEQRLRNVLNAYYQYEIMKLKKNQDEKGKGGRRGVVFFGPIVILACVLAILLLFLDYIEITKPF